MIIKRNFQFDAAHMLSYYAGKCANLHGHTYTGEVQIIGSVDKDTQMVLDFNSIKEVISKYDHTLIVSSSSYRGDAEAELLAWAKRNGMNWIPVKGKCTAENIVKCIAEDIADELHDKYVSITVWLHETPGSTVIWRLTNGAVRTSEERQD